MIAHGLLLVVFLIAGSACGPAERGSDSLPLISPTTEPSKSSVTTVIFDLPARGAPPWGSLPVPAQLADGSHAVTGFPAPDPLRPPFVSTFDLIAKRDGHCTTCTISFFFDGPLAPDTIAKGFVIVGLDQGDPAYGTALPFRSEYDDAQGRVTLRPTAPLRPSSRYVALVTDALLGADGFPVARPDAFETKIEDARLSERWRDVRDPLAKLGLLRSSRAFTVFETADPTRELRAVRARIEASRRPVATVDRVWTGGEIDELLGVPGDALPGFERPSGAHEGWAVRHETTRFVITGTFAAPRFVVGTGTDVGEATRDDHGTPISVSEDDVPFVLIVPRDANLAELPVIVAHHGFSASRTVAFVHADTAGRAGWGVLAIDAYQHGERAASATDHQHALRGIDGADGFSETIKLDVVSRVFGFAGVPMEARLAPKYPEAAFLQFAADALSTLRFVREGELTAIRGAHPELSNFGFADDMVFVGNSMGAVVGAAVIASEPTLDAAILNVMPGSIIDTLVESGEFRPLSTRVFLPLLGVTEPFDEVSRSMALDPTVDLFRHAMEPVDPLALAHAARASQARVLVQLAEHDEVAAPGPSDAVVEAAGYSEVSRYHAMHGMLELSVQMSRYEAPLTAPHTPRAEPVLLENPIEDVHHEMEMFLRSLHEPER